MAKSTINELTEVLGSALEPLSAFFSGKDQALDLLTLLGWELPTAVDDIGLTKISVEDVVQKLEKVKFGGQVRSGGGSVEVGAYVELLSAVSNLLDEITAFAASIGTAFPGASDYITKTKIDQELPRRLIDFLIINFVCRNFASLSRLLFLTGIFQLEYYTADSVIYQTDHVRNILHYDRIQLLFSSPGKIFESVFGWGTINYNPSALLTAFGLVFHALGSRTRARLLPRLIEERLRGQPLPAADTDPVPQLLASFFEGLGWDNFHVGVSLVEVRPSLSGATDGGIGILPYIRGKSDLTYPLSSKTTLEYDASVDFLKGIAILIQPNQPAKLLSNVFSKGTMELLNDGHALIKFLYRASASEPISLLRAGDGLFVTAELFSIGGGVDLSGGVLSPTVLVNFKSARIFIDVSQLDSFLAKLIPVSVDIGFNFGIGWSGAYGFFFQGNASPAITIGLHQSLGPFTLDTLHAGLTVGGGDTLPFELSLTGKGSLGPFKVSVDRIGMNLSIAFHKGNLGPVDFNLRFKPPNGLGMELNAGLITGGGYLYIDPVKHRYAGILECSIADIVQVKIIGVLDTVLPDGRPEFSLLLVITTDFPPIQLSFGFTLNGVGGIGAVNRTMALDALRAGLHAGHLNSVLFPNNPIENAPQIISDLSSFFPPADGRYVFGPMFSLGWGTPTLITLNLGVILEIPDPVRLAILGQIKTALPSDDFAIIELHIDVLGAVDFSAKLLSIDGSLFNSRVTIYSVMGDMALRLGWGDNPNFALSVGGLNPRFQPPANFPALHRCSVCIGLGDNPRLSSNSYFAVTSNSLQFGANVDLYASAGDFSIHGFIGWDALFIVSPFSFVIDFSAGLDVEFEGESLCSIHVNGTVAGPRPWHVHGDASFHILFIDISASVDLSWGDRDPIVLPPVQVLPDLQRALADPRSWSTVMPGDLTQAVSLAPRPPGDKALIVHPVGTLQVREKVVPLDQTISKYGNAHPSDGTFFTISSVTVDGRPETQQKLTDEFAIGQYTDLTDDQKLTAPSYQPMNSGISIGSNDVIFSRDVPCIVAYQDGYIDEDHQPLRIKGIFMLPLDVHLAYSRLGAGFVSALRTRGVQQFTEPGTISAVQTTDLNYILASTEDLSVRADIIGHPVTQFEAYNLLSAHLAANPSERGAVQVVAIHEVAA